MSPKRSKRRPFPNVPTREKIGAVAFLVLSFVAGIALIDAGDESETRTEKRCPEGSGPGQSATLGINCERPRMTEPPPRSVGLAEQIGDVVINADGGPQSPGTVMPAGEGMLQVVVPLFAIGVPHTVEFRGAQGAVVDGFTFTVPAASGPVSPITTQQGGAVTGDVDHTMAVLGGNSGGFLLYMQPSPVPTPTPTPDGGTETVEPVISTFEDEIDAPPWSLLIPPGALALVGGALFARNACMGEPKKPDKKKFDKKKFEKEEYGGRTYPDWEAGPFDAGRTPETSTATYPDWDTTYPDWEPGPRGSRPTLDIPMPDLPPAPGETKPEDKPGYDDGTVM